MEEALCGNIGTFMTFNGAMFLLSVVIALTKTLLPREYFTKGVKALSEENPLAFITPDIEKFRHSFQIRLPRCGVVMPVKGVHDQSYENWRAQITSMYGGALEFYFCIESEDDPAHPHILRLIKENPECSIHLMIAGVSWHCSQKIHNQVYGFERAMHCCEYVIVLDDDIKLHPGTIRAWVEELESDATALAASGYAFEYVRKGETSFVPYLAMLWRLMASNGFQHPKDRPVNCWGGAMMFRSQELRRNLYRLTDAWCDGGYSEDFITLSTARHHRRTIAVPKTALFPNELGGIQFDRFWNFMCRQVFVLTKTYASGAQRFIAFGGSFFNALAHLSIFLGTLAATPLTLFTAYTLFAPRRSPPGSPAAAAASGPFALLGFDGACASSPAVPSALVFWMLLGVFGYIGQRTMRSFANLCNVLSPHGYGNEPIDVSHIGAVRLCLAYLIYCPLIPAAHIATLLSSSIVWAGVNFHIANGRVSKMERKDGKGGRPVGEWYTVPREVSLERTLKELAQYRIDHDGVLGAR